MASLNFDASQYKPATSSVARVWSDKQKNIFSFVETGQGNAIVEAVAGSGKSTTIVEAMERVKGSALFLAFNKSIATELKARGVDAKTFHSLTYGVTLNFKGAPSVTMDKKRQVIKDVLVREDEFLYSNFVERLVSLAYQMGAGPLVPINAQMFEAIRSHHDLNVESENATNERGIDLAVSVYRACLESPMVDFDDMLLIPVMHKLRLPRYDFIFVDEAQDTNAIQRALLSQMMTPGTRMIAVGDPSQAIYGFRGADSDSMNILAKEFSAIRLPLSISYRCPVSVVNYAKQWAPHIEAAPKAQEGVVQTLTDIPFEGLTTTDLILCRTTAPLIATAFKLMRRRIPMYVMGRELGAGLKALVRRSRTTDMETLLTWLENDKRKVINRHVVKNETAQAEAASDKYDSLICLVKECESVDDIYETIDVIFKEKSDAVVLSSIHRAKGLEAPRVFWLNRSMCPPPWVNPESWQYKQELNICYVAATRAMLELYMVDL